MAEQTHSETQVSESLPLTNELLMDEVRKYTALYDRYNKDFKDKFKKLNAWTEIGKRFGISPSQAEKKYNNIRSSFVRYLRRKKKIPTGSGRKDLPPPPEFTNLDWLVTFIEHKYTSSNFQRSLTSRKILNKGTREKSIKIWINLVSHLHLGVTVLMMQAY